MPRISAFSRPSQRVPLRSSRWLASRRLPLSLDVAEVTGPLADIVGRQILVLADVENLNGSARDLGCRFSYRALAATLRQQASTWALHAFFSREPGDERRVHYFLERGWIPHPRDIETVQTFRGLERKTNSDNLILFMAGVLISRSPAEVVILASGDGALVCDLAKALSSLPKRRQVVTMSLAGSTSRRLDAATNSHITANIEIGRDCLHPITRSTHL